MQENTSLFNNLHFPFPLIDSHGIAIMIKASLGMCYTNSSIYLEMNLEWTNQKTSDGFKKLFVFIYPYFYHLFGFWSSGQPSFLLVIIHKSWP